MEEAAPGDQGGFVNLPPGDKSPDGPPDEPHCRMRRKMRRTLVPGDRQADASSEFEF
jgi:hypothetical protein